MTENKGMKDELSDFTADKRVLLLSACAVIIGAASAFVAKALVWLIALITNLSFFHTLSPSPSSPAFGSPIRVSCPAA